jgi:hypothetical protein
MFGIKNRTIYLIPLFVLAAVVCVPAHAATLTSVPAAETGGFGVIRGVVRDQAGAGIADATVAVFKEGTSQLLKQVRSASDGSFLAKIMPGTYTVLAVAEGFNPVTVASVDVGRAADLVYGFNLVRAGAGNTLHERALDKNSAKWRVRAANASRTIYQNVEGKPPVDVNADADAAEADETDPSSSSRPGRTVVETYFASSSAGNFAGVNIASFVPITENAEIILAGQASSGKNGPSRIEAQLKLRPNARHQLGFTAGGGRLGTLTSNGIDRSLSELSFQALDQWTVREGVVFVFGADYSRLVGAGTDASLTPRLGFQYDLDSKTRFRAAYTAPTDKRTWGDVADLEDTQVAFQEPVEVQDLIVNGHPQLNKSRRFEFGVERVLDNRSSIETTAFLDTTLGRGVGLANLPFDMLDGAGFGTLVADQQGKTQGLRVVYNRRLASNMSAAAGYSFGNGQRLSGDISDPSKIFENGFFQSLFGQLSADFKTGTNVQTIFRFSPEATVFAIDPFQGRLAIYDPSLSVMVTQTLPTFGIPVHAEAIVDARNLFDISNSVNTDDGTLRINSQRRVLRGGILVRF